MAKHKRQIVQTELVVEPIKQGDRVSCHLGEDLFVYWVSKDHSMVWVMVSETSARPVWVHECRKASGDATAAQ